jgi:lysophospholipid acyltransferase (LPLAT)-like uncharacterized protein
MIKSYIGSLIARYLTFVWNVNSVSYSPQDASTIITTHVPCIIAMWHGQHFMIPLAVPNRDKSHVLVAEGFFGAVYTKAFSNLGLTVVRGSTGRTGYRAFKQLLRALASGASIAITIDAPKVARKAGFGAIALAKHSGQAIIPIAAVASRRIIVRFRWDKPAISLPWGRLIVVVGKPIFVNRNLGRSELDQKRQELERELESVHRQAYALVAERRQL